jgi:hypothetical protein
MSPSFSEEENITAILSTFDEKRGPVPLAMSENWRKFFSDDQLLNLVMSADVSVRAFDRRAGLGIREKNLQGPLQIPVQPDFVGLIWPWMSPAPESVRLKRGRLHCLILIFPRTLMERLLEKIPIIQEYLMYYFNTEKITKDELNTHTIRICELVLEDEDYLQRALKVAFNSASKNNTDEKEDV